MRPRALLLPLALLLAGAAFHGIYAQAGRAASIHARGTDDAYISFRYAENLVRGEGLVYNPGERVEGYSNLLHVLVSAALLLVVDRDTLYAAVTVVNLLLLAVLFLVFTRHAERRLGRRPAWIAALLLSLAPPLWAWTISGMETIGVVAVQVWIWALVDRWDDGEAVSPQLAAALGLAVLARTDGFVVAALVVAYWIWRRRFDRALLTAGLTAPFVVLLFGSRLLYFGKWWPNTYYVKVSGPLQERLANAAGHLVDLMLGRGLVLFIVAVAAAFAWTLVSPRARPGSFGPFLASGVLAYWLYVGGDHFGDRFLLLVIPVGIVTGLGALARVDVRWPPLASRPVRIALVAILVAIALAVQLWPLAGNPRFRYGLDHYDGWITLGRYLGEHSDDDVLLAVDAAGKIPYFADRRAIDMRGLTDPYIATLAVEQFKVPGHNKMDPRYVLSKEPDLIATWIWPDLRAAAGLSRELYTSAGYRVALLANSSSRSLGDDVIDVRSWDDAELVRQIRRGYRLAVLEKQASR